MGATVRGAPEVSEEATAPMKAARPQSAAHRLRNTVLTEDLDEFVNRGSARIPGTVSSS